MVAIALTGRLRQRQLAGLLPVRRRRSLAERIRLGHCQAEERAAEEALSLQLAHEAAIGTALRLARSEEGQRIREGTTGATLRAGHERIEWLEQDLRSAREAVRRADDALAQARQRVDESRQRLLVLDERVRQLETLVSRARLLEDRRVALRLETRFAERMAAERRRQAVSGAE